MTTKQGFSFVKKKIETNVSPATSAVNEDKKSTDSKKPGFVFIKKSNANHEQQNTIDMYQHAEIVNEAPSINTNDTKNKLPLKSLDSLLSDAIFFQLMDEKKNINEDNKSTPQVISTILPHTTASQNNSSAASHENDTPTPTPTPTSEPTPIVEAKPQKSFGFVKKKGEKVEAESQAKGSDNVQSNKNVIQTNDTLSVEEKSFKSLKMNMNSHEEEEKPIGLSQEKNVNRNKDLKRQLEVNKPSITVEIKKEAKSSSYLNPEQIKAKCIEEIKKSEDLLRDLVTKIHIVKINTRAKEAELAELQNEQEKQMAKEQEAIDSNDFELADKIENRISITRATISKVDDSIEDYKTEMIQLREQELILIRNRSRAIEEGSLSFSKLKQDQEMELESFLSNDVTKHKNENIRLAKTKEKLHFLKSNLDTEKSFIDEEEEKITKVIKSQSSGVFEELDELNHNKAIINEEIEELRAKIEQKMALLDNLNKQIESKEIEIDAIKSNFNHEFGKLDYKKRNYEESLKDYLEQEGGYLAKINNYQAEEAKLGEKIQTMKNNLQKYSQEISEFKEKLTDVNSELTFKDDLLKVENEIHSRIHLINLRLEKTQRTIAMDNEEIENLHVNIKRLESEISAIDQRIPTLEEEKKSYVLSKNFREAGRASNELKSALEKRNGNLTKIGDNKKRIEEIKDEVGKLSMEISRISSDKFKEVEEMDMNRYEYLISYRDSLKRFMNEKVEKEICDELKFTEEEIAGLEKLEYIKKKEETTSIPQKLSEERDEDLSTPEGNIVTSDNDYAKSQEIQEDDLKEETEKPENPPPNPEEIEQKIKELEEELQACIDKEDYEKADQLQGEIDRYNLMYSMIKK